MNTTQTQEAKHTETAEPLTMSVGRDYNHPLRRYEYVIFRGDNVAARSTGFLSAATARRAGLACGAAITK